jgi:hypothetical protein
MTQKRIKNTTLRKTTLDVKLSVAFIMEIMLSIVVLSVMLGVILLSVVANIRPLQVGLLVLNCLGEIASKQKLQMIVIF